MITSVKILTCDTKLAEKNAVAYEKALQTFEKNRRWQAAKRLKMGENISKLGDNS